jgi:hypothetical protein
MRPVKESAMRRLALVVVMMSIGGCGGSDGDEASGWTSKLVVAPTALVERDLPGCDVVRAVGSARWGMMRHPQHSELVLVTRDSQPVCVDTPDVARASLSAVGTTIGQLTMGVTEETSSTPPSPPPPESSNEHRSTVGTKLAPSPHSLIADDPLPPPGHPNALVLRN